MVGPGRRVFDGSLPSSKQTTNLRGETADVTVLSCVQELQVIADQEGLSQPGQCDVGIDQVSCNVSRIDACCDQCVLKRESPVEGALCQREAMFTGKLAGRLRQPQEQIVGACEDR